MQKTLTNPESVHAEQEVSVGFFIMVTLNINGKIYNLYGIGIQNDVKLI